MPNYNWVFNSVFLSICILTKLQTRLLSRRRYIEFMHAYAQTHLVVTMHVRVDPNTLRNKPDQILYVQSTANQTIHFGLCTVLISRAVALISNCKCITWRTVDRTFVDRLFPKEG
jgi:hypothetical protein